MHRILRINLTERQAAIEPLPATYRSLGGRGLTARIISDEVPPTCDPLGTQNKLVFAAGLCAGTSVPNSGRLSVGAKSPLTGTIKESNAGGSVAQKIARLGFRAVIVEGAAKEPVTVKIDRDGIRFESAAALAGRGNYQVIELLKNECGPGVGIVSIGQAGEMRLKAAAISVTTPDFHVRVAARGGLGALMGAKGLKALVLDDAGCEAVPVADPERLKVAVQAFTRGVLSHPLIGGLKAFGTPILVNMMDAMGTIVTKNYSQGRFAGAEQISGEHMAEIVAQRPNAKPSHACMRGCVIQCSNIYTDPAGELVVAGIEYETVALMGSNCLIDDLDAIAAMNRACNDFGLDTMDVGGALAVAMEAGLLAWGDAAAAVQLVAEIGAGSERGRMIGNGVKHTGEALGVTRIPHVKGQCLSGYDPRGLKGTGVTYATATMGADHTCGNALPSPANPGYDPAASSAQAPVSQFLQRYFAAVDSLGICLFAMVPPLDMPELQQHLVACVAAIVGEELGSDYLLELGGAVVKVEKAFNDAAGFTSADDRLPDFFSTEALPETGQIFDVATDELDSVHAD
jgi:aldehyde:ferredoxin oxidoreductase